MSNVERIYIDFTIFSSCVSGSLSLLRFLVTRDVSQSRMCAALDDSLNRQAGKIPLYFANSAVQIPSRSL